MSLQVIKETYVVNENTTCKRLFVSYLVTHRCRRAQDLRLIGPIHCMLQPVLTFNLLLTYTLYTYGFSRGSMDRCVQAVGNAHSCELAGRFSVQKAIVG